MKRRYSLAQLTTLELAPPAMISTAYRTGYQACGIRLLPVSPGGVGYPLMDDPALLKETLARMGDTGVRIADLEIIRLTDSFNVGDYMAFFEVGQKLGASNILVAGNDTHEARATESFARLCEACKPYGLTADIEFMPWLPVDRISAAQRIVEAAGQTNGGVLVDPLHFARSASTLDELAALPGSMIHYAQICDAPAGIPSETSDLIHAARCARLPTGEGGIDLKAIFERIPPETLISVEIPNDELRAGMSAEAWAERCLRTSKQLLDQIDAENR
ncbi:sugar phosphate isomerase/epimerase [uncultured Castellaniella sp.]|uniref:sugar phosphate isomerase/epimerase family protein n=1 Tax=uncultured Castellaniella sp. TaxID=647907 RepID=UPI00262C7905|nr:sugar phosphate isomerase/epimerase [uncultured Castellaniella sp.]